MDLGQRLQDFAEELRIRSVHGRGGLAVDAGVGVLAGSWWKVSIAKLAQKEVISMIWKHIFGGVTFFVRFLG